MKLNNKSKKFIIFLIVAFIVVASIIVFANTMAMPKSNDVVTRDHSSVYFEQVKNDPTKIDVYLGMNDTASIASFQVGLEIDMADCYDSTFDWTTGDLANKSAKLKEAKISETEKDEVTGNIVENLNLYYVGTEELNNLTNNVDVDHVKLGTITIVPDKDENGNDAPLRTSFVAIKSRDDFSKTVSLSHVSENIKTTTSEAYAGKLVVKEAPTVENLTANVEAVVEGDVPEGEKTEGSKVVVNFEVLNETESLTALEVKLVDEQGNAKYTKTLKVDNLANEIPVSFVKVEEGKYKVQVIGSYTLDDGNPVENQVLKTLDGTIEVVHTEEPTNPPPTEPDDPGTTDPSDPGTTEPSDPGTTEPDDPGTTEPSDPGTTEPSDPGTTEPSDPGTTEPSDPGQTEQKNPTNPDISKEPDETMKPNEPSKTDNDDKSNDNSIGNKIIEAIKTGANHSTTWAVITLIVLAIIAVVIIKFKVKNKRKSKH